MTRRRLLDDAAMIALLEAAGPAAPWPATPDIRAAVAARLESPTAPDVRPAVLARIGERVPASSPATPLGRRHAWSLVLAAVLVLAVAGLAVGLGLGLPGVDITRTAETPAVASAGAGHSAGTLPPTPPPTPPAGAGLDLGSPVPVDAVLGLEVPRVRLPAVLPRPDTAYREGTGEDAIVSVVWRAAAGEPTLDGSDLALTLLATRAMVEEPLLSKLLGPGTTIEPVTVGDTRGWWISGAPHEILVRRPGTGIVTLRTALAGDTLLFVRDGTLYRLESAFGLDRTLEIAASLR